MTDMNKISKQLIRNDISATNAHQAGRYILKSHISFFHPLNKSILNPRETYIFTDDIG